MSPDRQQEPDEFQQAWQKHSSRTRVTVDADMLLKEVQRNQREARALISFGDFNRIGTSVLLLPVWIAIGLTMASPWIWWLMVPAIFWSIVLTLIVRVRRRQKPSEPGGPLLQSVKESLALSEHQIWWTRNFFWWGQLPTAIAMLTIFAHFAWTDTRRWWDSLGPSLVPMLMVVALFVAMYYLNQYVLRTQYEPRRQELLALLNGLKDETTNGVSGDFPILLSATRVEWSPRRMFVASLCSWAILLIGVPGILFLGYRIDQYLSEFYRRSPFVAVRWQESQPEVKLRDEWFKLVSLDRLPAAEMVAFSQRTYGDNWRMGFAEHLIELLGLMGDFPQGKVTLVVQSLTSHETRTIQDVPLTRANYDSIRAADKAGKHGEQKPPATKSPAPSGGATQFRSRIDKLLRAARTDAGFSGVVLVARGCQTLHQRAFGFRARSQTRSRSSQSAVER